MKKVRLLISRRCVNPVTGEFYGWADTEMYFDFLRDGIVAHSEISEQAGWDAVLTYRERDQWVVVREAVREA